jgi:hypothetical protein
MQRAGRIISFGFGFGFSFAAVCAFGQPAFMLTGGTVHTVSGAVIDNGSVLVRDGRIIGVGHDLHAPEGTEVIDLHGQHVYPGMIDSAAMPADEQLPAARANGVTGVVEISGEEILPGQIRRVDMPGSNVTLHLQFPVIPTIPIPPHEPQDDDDEPTTAIQREPIPWTQAKKTHDDQLRILNKFFDDARRYLKRKQTGNKAFDALQPVLEGASPMLVTAVRGREIREAIAFADKQKIRIILADAYESYKVIPLIKARDIPVVLGPPLSLPLNDDDPYDRSYTTAAALSKAGVRFSIGTFSQRGIRNLPYQAAATVPFGLSHDEAYKAISLYPAQIFGLSKRLGSIEEGKSANLIVTDGDPMEASTHVTQVFIDGKPVSLETRQKRLADQYSPPR